MTITYKIGGVEGIATFKDKEHLKENWWKYGSTKPEKQEREYDKKQEMFFKRLNSLKVNYNII